MFSKRSQAALRDAFRQGDIISAEEVYMLPSNGGQTRNVSGLDLLALAGHLCNRLLHVNRVPMRDSIEGKAESAELFFLPLTQGDSDLTAITVVDFSSQLVAEFLTVELDDDTPSEVRIINVVQNVQGFDQAPKVHQRLSQRCRAITHLQDAHDAFRFQVTKLEGPRKADQIFPVFDNGSIPTKVRNAT